MESNVQGQTVPCHVGAWPADYRSRSRRCYNSERKRSGAESLCGYAGAGRFYCPAARKTDSELPERNPALAEETEIAAEQLAENNLDTVTAERTKEEAWNPEEENVQEAGTGLGNVEALALNFSDTSSLSWPVRGNVVLNYSMDSTIYFPTLDQYKCNPGMVIQGDISEPVYAPANARVVSVGNSEEIGTYLTLDLGNEYSVICGQLKEVAAVEGEYLEKGQLIGYVAEPTKYYTVEGSNLYLEMLHKDSPVDPLDYLE